MKIHQVIDATERRKNELKNTLREIEGMINIRLNVPFKPTKMVLTHFKLILSVNTIFCGHL